MRLPGRAAQDPDHLSAHWFGRMLSALYVSTFMIRASFAIMLIAFPVYIIGLKSYFLFGLVLASSPLAELITVMGLGAYIDRHGRKRVLLLGLLTGSVALFALLLTKDAVPLFVINAFHGMSAAAILVSSLALLADYAPPERRGKVMGAFDFVNIFGWISGFGIGGVLIDVYRDDIGMTFVIAGLMGVAAFGWAYLNIHEPRGVAHRVSEISFSMIASVLKQRSVILLILPWFIIYLLISTMLTFTSKAGTQELGLSGIELGILLGGGGGVFLVTQVIYGHLSDKYGRTKIMGVGTVGIVGIMLTVGSVFLSAPASVAPAATALMSVNADADIDREFLLQSDFGVYLIDSDGTVLREFAPPEGGFGEIRSTGVQGLGTEGILLAGHDSLEIFALSTETITWAQAAPGARLVAAADIGHDGQPEFLYLGDDGLHVTGPAVHATVPAVPPIPPGAEVLDLAWYASGNRIPGIYALYQLGEDVSLVLSMSAGISTIAIPAGFESIDLPGGDLLTLRGLGGLAVFNESTGAVEKVYGVPVGWSTTWFGYNEIRPPGPGPFDPSLQLIAYGPSGGGGVFFREPPGSTPVARHFDLPSGMKLARLSWEPTYFFDNIAVFTGFAANGSWVRATVDLEADPPAVNVTDVAVVKVVRESAQSVFGQLTSIPVAATIGVFALMAGAFGPAALAGLTDVAQEDKRGTTMGLYSVVISTSMIVGPVVTGFLVDNYGGFGVMVFLASSAAAMALFMGLRAWDVRRAGGERALREKTAALKATPDPPESKPEPPSEAAEEGDAKAPDEKA